MATSDTPPNNSDDGPKPYDLPQWQYDNFCQIMQRWSDACFEKDPEQELPETLYCYVKNPKAAFHFHSFVSIVLKWQGEPCPEPFDALIYLREEESKIYLHLKKLMLSMETDMKNGKLLTRTCTMETKDLHRAVFGVNERSKSYASIPLSLINQAKGIAGCLDADRQSNRWELYHTLCINLIAKLLDTFEGLESLLRQDEGATDSPEGHEGEDIPVVDGATGTEQDGLRRRRPGTQREVLVSQEEAQNPSQESKDHTPIEAVFLLTEAMFLLTKALNAAFRRIPFADLRDALWRDPRAPTSLSLVFTSISSILIGVALASHNNFSCYNSPRIDDGFFMLLSTTIIQLFSLYILFLPLLRGQEPHLKSVWFCLSVGLSVILSIISCVVYAFSWHASAILGFGGTLTSMITALLLVQGIDKGITAKETEATNGDV